MVISWTLQWPPFRYHHSTGVKSSWEGPLIRLATNGNRIKCHWDAAVVKVTHGIYL